MRHLSDIKPGQVIGRYEFLAPIAQGGMAAVWAARQRGSRGFSKVVAIKTMLPCISEDPRFERMFLDEAQIASRIRHENVVEILDLGEQNEILYLVMQWVDGESLSVLRRRAGDREGIPLRMAVRIVADACAGLHAAHELVDDEGRPFGLVHRDVSPQNILVGYDGSVKILDFGVAKVAGRTSDTTNIGHARGKPPYMAPEQALGKAIDRRADVFSLGIIFYQLLVGRHPFRGENDIATLHNIISDQPVARPREVNLTIPESVEAIALRAIERDPERRFRTAREFELALEALLDTELGRVRPEDIAQLMGAAMGPVQEERRGCIRDAIRLADSAEATQIDVSVAPLGVSTGANRSPTIKSAPSAGSGAHAESAASGAGSRRVEAIMLQERGQNVSEGEAPRHASAVRSAWWQVLLAMVAGAILAWLGSTWIPRPRTRDGFTHTTAVLSPKVGPAVTTSAEPGQPAALVSAMRQSGETRDVRHDSATRRAPTSGNRSAAGGAVNPLNALPPVPSPGF